VVLRRPQRGQMPCFKETDSADTVHLTRESDDGLSRAASCRDGVVRWEVLLRD